MKPSVRRDTKSNEWKSNGKKPGSKMEQSIVKHEARTIRRPLPAVYDEANPQHAVIEHEDAKGVLPSKFYGIRPVNVENRAPNGQLIGMQQQNIPFLIDAKTLDEAFDNYQAGLDRNTHDLEMQNTKNKIVGNAAFAASGGIANRLLNGNQR